MIPPTFFGCSGAEPVATVAESGGRSVTPAVAAAGRTGEAAERLLGFDVAAGELPEGIAVDKTGNVFTSIAPLGQLWKVKPGSPIGEGIEDAVPRMGPDLVGIHLGVSGMPLP